MSVLRIPYRRFKQVYPDCETVPGSYDQATKTIEVIIPDGRMAKSGVRGKRFDYYRFTGVDRSGKPVEVRIKAVCMENAVKQLRRNYDPGITWDA